MKKMIFSLFAAVGLLAACNDFDPVVVPYEPDDTVPFTPSPPTLDAAWMLQEIPNVGQHAPTVYVYKDKLYDALFTRTLGWNGGDGVFTTRLPDGNVFWSFNDSFYGVVDGETRARGSSSFPRNSIMVQRGTTSALGETDADLVWLADYVQTTDPETPRYYQARTHLRNPDATLSDAAIAAGDIDQDFLYWAGDATVHDNRLQMTWGAVDVSAGDGSMIRYRTALAEYSLQGTPGDGTYMSLVNVDHDFLPADALGYGSTLLEDGDHVYLYCTYAASGSLLSQVLVARTATRDLGSEWSWYIRDLNGDFRWQTTYPTATERDRSYIQTQTCSMPWVFEKEGTYYMVFESYPFGRAMYIARGDAPYGPFTDQKLLFTLPKTLDKTGDPYPNHWYMVNLHDGLSRDGELVFSTNSDPANFWDNFNYPGSADYYRPYFFRVYNWESVYDE